MENTLSHKTIFVLLMVTAFYSCNQKSTKSKVTTNPLEIIEEAQNSFDTEVYYVMATQGLSLRKAPNLQSDRVLVMHLGAKLTFTELPNAATDTIDYIPGRMVNVTYNEQKGYAYSGYLTRFYIPNKTLSAEEYKNIAVQTIPGVRYQEFENGPDFHQGYHGELLLPKASWHEAFYIAKSIYGIPASISFPNPRGKAKEIIEQKNKDANVWSSELYVTRNSSNLDTLQYSFREEGFGWGVTLFEKSKDTMQINHIIFVD